MSWFDNLIRKAFGAAVNASGLSDGEILTYNASTGEWGNTAASSGVAETWVFQGGISAVNGTATTGVNWGRSGVTSEAVCPVDGEIWALSIGLSDARTQGTCTMHFVLNGTQNTTDTVVIDATNTQYHYNELSTPVSFSAGDRIDIETVTSGFQVSGADATCCVFCRKT